MKFSIIQTGSLAVFDFQALLLVLTTSLALLAIATTIVDNLAVNVLPLKKLYAASKYDETEDFTTMQYEWNKEGGHLDDSVYMHLTRPLKK